MNQTPAPTGRDGAAQRTLRAALLCLLLLAGQCAAAAHAFEHGRAGEHPAQIAPDTPVDTACALCLAAGGVGHLLPCTGSADFGPCATMPAGTTRSLPQQRTGAAPLARAPPAD